MSDCVPEPNEQTIDGILAKYGIVGGYDGGGNSTPAQRLRAELMAREDNMADVLRLAGAQYGLFPQIVAEVLATIGLGTPISTEQRALVHSQWHALMDQLREEGEQQ